MGKLSRESRVADEQSGLSAVWPAQGCTARPREKKPGDWLCRRVRARVPASDGSQGKGWVPRAASPLVENPA